MPYGVGVRVPLSAQRSLHPGLLFRCPSGAKEGKSVVYHRFAKDSNDSPNRKRKAIREKTRGSTKGSGTEKRVARRNLLPNAFAMRCFAAFYVVIILSCGRFVNPQNFNVMRQETFAILFLMQKGRPKKNGLAPIFARITTGGGSGRRSTPSATAIPKRGTSTRSVRWERTSWPFRSTSD